MADRTRCDACGQAHPGPADEWGVFGAPQAGGGTRERLLCPQCASAVTSLFGSRGAALEAAAAPAPARAAPAAKPAKAATGARRNARGGAARSGKARRGQKR